MARTAGVTEAATYDPRQWSRRVSAAMLARLAGRAAVSSTAPAIPVEAPFTGETLAETPLGSAADIAAAVAAARASAQAWARRPFGERAAVMLRFHDLVLDNADEVLDIIQLESGKARRHALEEVLDVAVTARYYAHTAAAFLRPRRVQGALPLLTAAWEHHQPRGVVGIIAPWNYPLTLAVGDAIPALMAGNGIVLKPDAQTPLTALWAAGLFAEAGLPEGLFQVVTGRGRELGEPLADGADYLMFTGSTAVGRTMARLAAERLKDCSMELGGKNPLLVLPDADLSRAAAGAARGVTSNSGQLCISIERIYVHAAVYGPFVARLVDAVRALRLGASLTYADDMGSLISAEQLAAVRAHVDDAVAKGAELLAGGKARPDLGPCFYEPTLLAGVTPEMESCSIETFGPVAAVYRCASVPEMVAAANDSSYGLNASIWTRNVRAGRDLAARLQSGSVNINEAYSASWASAGPMGGFKESGLGRRHGQPGIMKYTEAQTVAAQRLLAIDTPPFLNHRQYAAVMLAAVKLLRRVPGIK